MDDAGARELATPTLMRAARGVYARSIRAELQTIGIDDLPRNGAFILAGIDTAGGPRPDLPATARDVALALAELEVSAVGVHCVNLPGLAGLATHQDELMAVGRPVHHKNLHGACC